MLSTTLQDNQCKYDIPPFFHKTLHDGILNTIPNRTDKSLMCVFSVKPNSPELGYLIAAEIYEKDNVPKGMVDVILPAATYATTKIVKNGFDSVYPVLKYMREQWIAENGYVHAKQSEFVYYDDSFICSYLDSGYSDKSIATIYIPIERKSS
jgi:predicted transcriptional regulator YdeE